MFARWVCGASVLCLGIALVGCSTPYVSSIAVTPTTETFVGPGGTAQFKAIGTFQQGEHTPWLEDVTNQVTWATNASGVATITKTGAATGTGLGTTTVTATMDGYKGIVIGTATITVCQPSPTLPGQCQVSPTQ
jgi:hypothetical protein